jgi:hypothetical protein
MKKFVVGLVMGAVLATAGSVYAEDIKSLVGTTIKIEGQYPVKVAGVTAEKPAIVFNGTSYLPVRAIGDALGMNVVFNADLGIELTPKEVAKKEVSPVSEVLTMTTEDEENINMSEEQILKAENKISEQKARMEALEAEKPSIQNQIDITTDSQRLMYLKAELQGVQINIDSAKEQIKMAEDAIISMQAYIDKIKAKYAQ